MASHIHPSSIILHLNHSSSDAPSTGQFNFFRFKLHPVSAAPSACLISSSSPALPHAHLPPYATIHPTPMHACFLADSPIRYLVHPLGIVVLLPLFFVHRAPLLLHPLSPSIVLCVAGPPFSFIHLEPQVFSHALPSDV